MLFELEPPSGLRGMCLHEALDCLAVLNGGRVNATEARKTLVGFRVLPNDHAGANRMYRALRHSGRFTHAGHGRYVLERPYRPQTELAEDQERLLRRLRRGEVTESD